MCFLFSLLLVIKEYLIKVNYLITTIIKAYQIFSLLKLFAGLFNEFEELSILKVKYERGPKIWNFHHQGYQFSCKKQFLEFFSKKEYL